MEVLGIWFAIGMVGVAIGVMDSQDKGILSFSRILLALALGMIFGPIFLVVTLIVAE